MSGNKGGFAVGISVVDQASAKLDAINKRLTALSAPATRFNKSMAKFGEVTGINKAAEGMSAFGDRALGAARAVERLAGPMALLTSAGSIAGIAALGNQWAETGTSIGKTANLLRMPVQELGSMRIAAKLATVPVDALDSSMQGLAQTLSDARYARAGNKMGLLSVLGIDPKAADGTAATALSQLDKVAEAVKARHADPSAQKLLLESLGMSPEMIPLLEKGAAGLAEFRRKAAATGGAMTSDMVEHATKMKSAWAELGAAIEGVDNRIVDSFSGTATKVMDTASRWIERNQKLADSYAKIGIGIGLLGALKPAAWLLRLLGLTATAAGAEIGIGVGAALGAGAIAGGMQVPMVDDYGRVTGNWGGRDESANPAFIGNTSGVGEKIWNIFQFGSGRNFGTGTGGSPPRLPGPRAAFLGGSGIGGALPADIEEEVRKNAIRDKLDPEHMVRLFRKEHGWGGPGYMGLSPAGARGPAQLMPGTADLMGVKPDSPWQDNVRGGVDYYAAQFARFGSYPGADAAYNAGPSGRGVQHFADTGDASQLPPETRDYVSSINGGAQNGHVTVDVNIKAPPGTTANTTSRGAVIARPALIETSMPGVH
jgi:hypothetical protein